MTITYGGANYDPFTDGDELSVMIVKKLAAEIKHTYDDKNEIQIRFA